ncbi:MAG: hypothetical protein K2P93_02160 [Alphaproteobacteria bacterium]|nr:hypothetical protein [Alphaproteobacteria bacterium]
MKISINGFPSSEFISGQTGLYDDIIISKNVIVPIGQNLFIDGGGGRDRIFDNAQGLSTITFHQDDRGYVGGNIGSVCGHRGGNTQPVTILSSQDNENVGLADGIRGLPSSPEIENFGVITIDLTGDNSKVNINYRGVTEASHLQNPFHIKFNGIYHTIDSETIINSFGSNDTVNFTDLRCWTNVTSQIPDSIKIINGIHYTVYSNHDALVLVNDPSAGPSVNAGPPILIEDDFSTTFSLHLSTGITVSSFTYTDTHGKAVTALLSGSSPSTFTAKYGVVIVNPQTGIVKYTPTDDESQYPPTDSFSYTTSDHVVHKIVTNGVSDTATLAAIKGAAVDGQSFTLHLNAVEEAEFINSVPSASDKGSPVTLETVSIPLAIYDLHVSSYHPGDSFSFNTLQGRGFNIPIHVQFGNGFYSNTTVLTGNAGADILVGGLNPHGFSELIGGGGYDNLFAVAGTTTFVIEDTSITSIQGFSGGKNTLVWDNSGDLNIADVRTQGSVINNIDAINMSSNLGAGASLKATHDVFLNVADVLNITHQSATNLNYHTLFVNGTSLDTVDLKGGAAGFFQSHQDTHPGYVDYTNSAHSVHVEVATAVHVHIM